MTHLDDNTLAQLVDGGLDDTRRAEIERHLDTCVTCSDLVAELAFVVAPDAREAPPGYHLVRELDGKVWEATATGDDVTRYAVGFGGPWAPTLVYVRHPNVAVVHTVGRKGDEGYIIHDPGTRTFRAWRAEGARSVEEILAVGAQVLAGLAALHEVRLVHGRLSPDHIFVEPDGRVLVGAFARELAKTSGYMAPELLDGAAPTPASDQFAVCAVLWEALVDARPFSGATPGALAVAMSTRPALPSAGPRRVLAVLQRGLAADATARWPSIVALDTALTSRPRVPLIAVACGAIAALASLAYLLVH